MSLNQLVISREVLLNVVIAKIAQQLKWRKVAMVWYIASASIVIVGSTCAAVIAGFEHSTYAAIFAGAAAIFASAEKGLLLGDRWKFHLKMLMRYEGVKLEIESRQGNADLNDLLSEVRQIMEDYADGVPISPEAIRPISEHPV